MEKETEEKTLKAKSVSLVGQMIAAIWCASWSAFFFLKNINSIKITDIIVSGVAIAGCFSPVYFSMILDKLKDIRWGD